MISALNPLRPLSGNKLVVALIMLLLGGIACSATRTPGYLPNRDVPKDSVANNHVPDKKKQEEEIQKQKHSEAPEFVNDFHVALFLPFFLNQEVLPNSREFYMVESVSDYYQGVLLALDKLKRDGIIITLHVYDTRKDSAHTVTLLRKPEMASMDLLIGPLDQGSFAAASSFSKQYEIPLLAPFSMIDREAPENPFAFYSSPALSAYGEEVAKYLSKQNNIASVMYISDNSKTDQAFKKGFQATIKDRKFSINERKLTSDFAPKSLLKKGEDSAVNYIILPSDDEKSVNMALRAFREAEDEGYLLQVIGLDSWLNFRDPEIEHWHKMSAVIATATFKSQSDTNYREFYHAFREMHKIPPGELALTGYDQMMFFGKALLTFGKHFPKYIVNTEFDGIGMDYSWSFTGRLIENRAVRLIHFQNYQFIPIK